VQLPNDDASSSAIFSALHHSFTTLLIVIQARALRVVCLFLFAIEPILRGTIAESDSSRLRHFMRAVKSGLHAGQHSRQPGEPRMQQLLRYLPSKPCFILSLCIFQPFFHFCFPFCSPFPVCADLNKARGSEFKSSHQSWLRSSDVCSTVPNRLWAQAVMVKWRIQ
jgi:hypothetical protein